jgi:hypothetical protein
VTQLRTLGLAHYSDGSGRVSALTLTDCKLSVVDLSNQGELEKLRKKYFLSMTTYGTKLAAGRDPEARTPPLGVRHG